MSEQTSHTGGAVPGQYMPRSVSAPAIAENVADAIIPNNYEDNMNEMSSPSRHNPRMSMVPNNGRHAREVVAQSPGDVSTVEGESGGSYGELKMPIMSLIGSDSSVRTPISLIQADFPSTPSSIFSNRVLSSDALNAAGSLPAGEDPGSSRGSGLTTAHYSNMTRGTSDNRIAGAVDSSAGVEGGKTGLESSLEQLYVSDGGTSSPIPSGRRSTSPMPVRRPGSTSPFNGSSAGVATQSGSVTSASLSLLSGAVHNQVADVNGTVLRQSLPSGVTGGSIDNDNYNMNTHSHAAASVANMRSHEHHESPPHQQQMMQQHKSGVVSSSESPNDQHITHQQAMMQQAPYYMQQPMYVAQNGQPVFYRQDMMYGNPNTSQNVASPLMVSTGPDMQQQAPQIKAVQEQHMQEQQNSPQSPQVRQQSGQQQQVQATFGLQYPGMGGQMPTPGYWAAVPNDPQLQMQLVANAAAASGVPFNLFIQNFGGNLAAAAAAVMTGGNSGVDGAIGGSGNSQRRMIFNPNAGQYNSMHPTQSSQQNQPSDAGSINSIGNSINQPPQLVSSGGSYPLGNSNPAAMMSIPGLMQAQRQVNPNLSVNDVDNMFMSVQNGNAGIDNTGSPSTPGNMMGNVGMNQMMGMMGAMGRNNMLPPSAGSGMAGMATHLQNSGGASINMGHPAGIMGMPGAMVNMGMTTASMGSNDMMNGSYNRRGGENSLYGGGQFYGMQQNRDTSGRGGHDYREGRQHRDRERRNGGGNLTSNNGNMIRDPLIEEFRNTNGKGRNWELRDLLGHVSSFCQDQHGSRFIQQRLEECSDVDKQLIFDEIIPSASILMTDVFGNYVLQKLFEFGSPEQCETLAGLLQGQAVQLSMHMYGCRVMQRALEYVGTAKLIELVGEFESPPLLMRCVYDSNGNHVIQKCIEVVSRVAKDAPNLEMSEFFSSRIQFIISTFQGQIKELSSHPYGCRVIQRVLEHCSMGQKAVVLEELRLCCHDLIRDCYGNYVIQFVMQHGWEPDRAALVQEVQAHLQEYSTHKFASNVVEKCLQFASKKDRDEIIWNIINVTFDLKNPVDARGQCALEAMVRDPYANYVVQKVIDVSDERQRAAIMRYVRENITQLRRYTYGKHIILRLEKLTNEKF